MAPKPPAPDAFEPKSLSARDLRAPVTAELRRLPPADRDRLRAERAALVERVHPLGTAMQRRLKHYVLRSVICFPLVTWAFTPVGFDMLWLQILLGVAYGVCVAVLQPIDAMAGWTLMAFGALILAATGHLGVGILSILYLGCYFCLGIAAGASVWLRRIDSGV